MSDVKSMIEAGKTSLGIEFGSTRIKAVLVGEDNAPIASGSHEWENRLDNGVWTYTLEDIWTGLQDCYRDLAVDVKKQYDVELTTVGTLGFSAMMHGYMVFDKAGEQLVPFRTWRNTMTEQAAKELTELFRFNMPQRWSGAHLYQAILNKEEHVKDIDFITTLAGYVHWKLTGEKVLGVGDASGMFPIDSTTRNWNKEMLAKFDELVAPKGYPWKVEDILPKVLVAGEKAGTLTEEVQSFWTQQESFRQAFRYALRKVMQEPVWQLRIASESAPVMYQQEPVYLQWLFLKKHLRKYMKRSIW